MKLVPTYRLIYGVGLVYLPLSLLMVMVSSIALPVIFVVFFGVIAIAVDAYRCKGRLEGIHITLPEVVRISKGRQARFKVQIENRKLKVRRLRLGFAFPAEIEIYY